MNVRTLDFVHNTQISKSRDLRNPSSVTATMSTSKSKMPTGYKMADTSTLTPEEEQWVKDHWGSEHHFLQAYGLNIYKEEDREEGRAITRGLMKQESHPPS
jgi:hypothetical protein